MKKNSSPKSLVFSMMIMGLSQILLADPLPNPTPTPDPESSVQVQFSPSQLKVLSPVKDTVSLKTTRVPGNIVPSVNSQTIQTQVNNGDGSSNAIDISLGAQDPDGDSSKLIYSISVFPSHASQYSLNGNVLTYLPEVGFVGQDAIAFEVKDERGGRSPGIIQIQVQGSAPVAPPPSFSSQHFDLNFGETKTFSPIVTGQEDTDYTINVVEKHLRGKKSFVSSPTSITYDPGQIYGHDFLFVVAKEINDPQQVSITAVTFLVAEPLPATITTSLYKGDPAQSGAVLLGSSSGLGDQSIKVDMSQLEPGTQTLVAVVKDASNVTSKTSTDFEIDYTPPTVDWGVSKPANDSCVSGSLTLDAVAHDNVGVQKVFLSIRGQSHDLEFTGSEPNYSLTFDTSLLPDGLNTFDLYAIDGGNLKSQDAVSARYNIDNSAPTLSSPEDKTEVSANPTIHVVAQDSGCGVSWIEVQSPGPNNTTTTSRFPNVASVNFIWNTNNLDNGIYTLILRAGDVVNHVSANKEIQVTLKKQNQSPVASISVNPIVFENESVQLDGSLSSDPDSATLSFTWTQISGPTVLLQNANSSKASFVAPFTNPGQDRALGFRLTVSDGQLSDSKDVLLTVKDNGLPNQNPIIDLPTSSVAIEKNQVIINQTSFDPEGDRVSILWEQVSGTPVKINDATLETLSFVAPFVNSPTDLVFKLTVKDQNGGSSEKLTTVSIHDGLYSNQVPVASINSTKLDFNENETVTLDGSSSTDPEGENLKFKWTQLPGWPVLQLQNENSSKPSMTIPPLGMNVSVTFSLVVTDPEGLSSDPKQITLNLKNIDGNIAPLAMVQGPSQISAGAMIRLDGAGSSDPDGNSSLLTYKWIQTEGTPSISFDSTLQSAYFQAPGVTQDTWFTFKLTVTDQAGLSSQETSQSQIRFVVNPIQAPINQIPIADGGPNLAVNEMDVVTLNGSNSSDPDGDSKKLQFNWTQISGPAVQFASDVVSPQFTAPKVAKDQILQFQLIVKDELGASSLPKLVFVQVKDLNGNEAPVAHVGATQQVDELGKVTLDGKQSSDPEKSNLTYEWTQISGPAVTLNLMQPSNPTFVAPYINSDQPVSIQFSLVVIDDLGKRSDPVISTVLVKDVFPNQIPTAVAGENKTADERSKVTLNGTSSTDPERANLTYTWLQIEGPKVKLDNPNSVTPTFTTPYVADQTDLKFQLTVTDDKGASSPVDTVVIHVVNSIPGNNPPNLITNTVDASIGEGKTIRLNGGDAWDPDGKPLTYEWTQVSGPAVTLIDSNTITPSFIAPSVQADTVLSFRFTVKDDQNQTAVSDTMKVTVLNDQNFVMNISSPSEATTIASIQTVSIDLSNPTNLIISKINLSFEKDGISIFNTDLLSFPYAYSWNTNTQTFPNGVYLIRATAYIADRQIQAKRNVQVFNAAPQLQVISPTPSQVLGGTLIVKVQGTGSIQSLECKLGDTSIPLTDKGSGLYEAEPWNTKILASGRYTLQFTAKGPNGIETKDQVDIVVDNTAPVVEWVAPDTKVSDIVISGDQPFKVKATDENGIDQVEFWFGTTLAAVVPETVGSPYFSYVLHTPSYSDNSGYTMVVKARDKAGNVNQMPQLIFGINNANPPRSSVLINEHPSDGSFAASDDDASIWVVFQSKPGGAQVDPASFNRNGNPSITVQIHKDNQWSDLSGAVEYKDGKLKFNGVIPQNSDVVWTLHDVRDSDGNLIDGQFKFIRPMSKVDGGEVYYEEANKGKLKIVIPKNALPENAKVVIEPLTAAGTTSSIEKATNNFNQLNQDNRDVAGPFKTYAINDKGQEITQLNLPATLIYSNIVPPSDAQEQSRVIQIQGLDGAIWRPLGTSARAAAGTVLDTPPLQIRSVTVQINRLSIFRISSVAVPGSGVSDLFNWPNPFTPSIAPGTNINYSLSEDSDVTILIYDLFGNLVKKLSFSPGSNGGKYTQNTVSWDGRNGEGVQVANGGYIAQVIAKGVNGGTSVARRKMAVVK